MTLVAKQILLLLMLGAVVSCSDDKDEEGGGADGIRALSIGQSVTGSTGDNDAQFSFNVDSGAEYNVVLTPSSNTDDPDLLIFSGQQQMEDYWSIADANGGEDSSAAIVARIAKSSKSPGEVDQATFTAGHNDKYFVMVSGPDSGADFSIVVNSSSQGYGCGDDCVERADVAQHLLSFSPSQGALVTDMASQLTLTFDDSFSLPLSQVNVEVFTLPADRDDCRIDWPGLRCGFLNAEESFDLTIGGGTISGTGTILNNTVIFDLSSQLSAGYVYLVHIFADDSNESYKTWWTFKT